MAQTKSLRDMNEEDFCEAQHIELDELATWVSGYNRAIDDATGALNDSPPFDGKEFAVEIVRAMRRQWSIT